MASHDLDEPGVLSISQADTAVVGGYLQTKRSELLQALQRVILNLLQAVILSRVIHFLLVNITRQKLIHTLQLFTVFSWKSG